MSETFKALRRSNGYLLYIFFVLYLSACSTAKQSTYAELTNTRASAVKTLNKQVDEFNHYDERPASDGHLDKQNNKAFLQENIPLFLCSDSSITKVYNYRWWMISKHLKAYADPYDKQTYWVFTEFFGDKPWATLSGAIPCPAGHQFYDVRWLRNPEFLKSYTDYYMRGSASRLNQRENANFLTYTSRPESHHFSSWMIDGIEAFLKVHPDNDWLHDILPHLSAHQQVWDSLFTVNEPAAKTAGMYKFLDLYDGMEFSLSTVLGLIASDGAYSLYTDDNWRNYYLGWETTGNAAQSHQAKQYPKAYRSGYPDFYMVRPTLNAYAYANLLALSNLNTLTYRNFADLKAKNQATKYKTRAEELQTTVLNLLWNEQDQFFYSYTAGDNKFGIRDFESRVRESVGYTPWYFNMIPFSDNKKYEGAWQMFASEKGFYNTGGMTTAEQQHPYYNEQAYAWNGRGWPFQNSVVYKAYANYLRNYKSQVAEKDRQLLYDYVQKLVATHGEKPNIGEWYIPSEKGTFGGEKDYFHSTFPDIIIADLLGFEALHENQFMVQPLLPENAWSYFYLGNIMYHGRTIDIIWKKDWNPQKEGNQSALRIWVDGRLTKTSDRLNDKVVVEIPPTNSLAIDNP